MERFLHGLWMMATNNGMYSTVEAVVTLIFSVVVMIAFFRWAGRKAAEEHRNAIIADLGYEGYLRHKELMQKYGIHVD